MQKLGMTARAYAPALGHGVHVSDMRCSCDAASSKRDVVCLVVWSMAVFFLRAFARSFFLDTAARAVLSRSAKSTSVVHQEVLRVGIRPAQKAEPSVARIRCDDQTSQRYRKVPLAS